MALAYEFEQETDGRWIAEIPDIPGALASGSTREDAQASACKIAISILYERIAGSNDRDGSAMDQLGQLIFG